MSRVAIELEDPDGYADPDELVIEEETLSEQEAFDEIRTPLPGIPSVDHEEPGPVAYLHYKPEDTKVVSGPVGPVKQFPGTRFPSKKAAKAHWLKRAGRIIEDLSIDGRWIFRVARDA